MNRALVISANPERLRELSTRLSGLGLTVGSCASTTAALSSSHAFRVVLWDVADPVLQEAGYALPAETDCAAISCVLHDLVGGDASVVSEWVASLDDTGREDLANYLASCARHD